MNKFGRRFETVALADVRRKGEMNGEPQSEPAAKARMRVLIVDDEKTIADTLTAIFNHTGYEAVASYDGSNALLQCESFHPDLMITDVSMPGMNGIELAILVKQRYPTCKILLFSGQAATVNLLDDARRKGHDFELLTKPIHPKELLEKVAEMSNARLLAH